MAVTFHAQGIIARDVKLALRLVPLPKPIVAAIPVEEGTPIPCAGADNFADATVLPGTVGQDNIICGPTNNCGFFREEGEPTYGLTGDGFGGTGTMWWQITPDENLLFSCDTANSIIEGGTDPILNPMFAGVAIYVGPFVSSLSLVAKDYLGPGDYSALSAVPLGAGVAYHVVVFGTDSTFCGDVFLRYSTAASNGPANDNFADAVVISPTFPVSNTTLPTVNNQFATVELGETLPTASSQACRTIWWKLTPTADVTLDVDTLASLRTDPGDLGGTLDTILNVFTGSSVDALTSIAQNDDFGGGSLSSSLTGVALTNGVTYYIGVAMFEPSDSTGYGDVVVNYSLT